WVDQFQYAPNPPVIISQPAGLVTNAGATVQLAVTASGLGQLFYQWRRNQTNTVGVNSPVLTLVDVNRANNGLYSVVVTNVGGSAISSNAAVKVLVPQKFTSPLRLAGGRVMFLSGDADGGSLTSADLAGFTALVSTNLVDWTPLPNALSITNGLLLLQDVNQTNSPARFYRILEP
ncbi:MAG: hypothetical protein JWR69_2477, partial [Pedosphaera sp.]|nr:hypothetical protein [Pedosphaera sp.]